MAVKSSQSKATKDRLMSVLLNRRSNQYPACWERGRHSTRRTKHGHEPCQACSSNPRKELTQKDRNLMVDLHGYDGFPLQPFLPQAS